MSFDHGRAAAILGGEFDHKRACNHWESNILYQFFARAYFLVNSLGILWFRVNKFLQWLWHKSWRLLSKTLVSFSYGSAYYIQHILLRPRINIMSLKRYYNIIMVPRIIYNTYYFARAYYYIIKYVAHAYYLGLYKDVTTLLWFRVLYTSLNMLPAYIIIIIVSFMSFKYKYLYIPNMRPFLLLARA